MALDVKSIAIVGTGVIGSSWAACYASKGFAVTLYDVDAQACRTGRLKAVEAIEVLRSYGLISDSTATAALTNLYEKTDLAAAVRDVQLVQESVAEDYAVKHDVYRKLDELTSPDTILASSSSGLLMSEIQKVARFPQRCLVAHPFNPPHLIPLVELVPGKMTTEGTIKDMKAFYEGLGKIPVILNKEAPGHLANRLSAALWREAIDIVMQGIASVEDVDKAICAGPGLRWAIMGQHLIYHLGAGEGGMPAFLKHFTPAFQTWWRDMAAWTELPSQASSVLTEGVEAEMAGKSLVEMTRWRDEKLIKLLKAIQA